MRKLFVIGVAAVVGYELLNHYGSHISAEGIIGLAVLASIAVALHRRGVGIGIGLAGLVAVVAICYFVPAMLSALVFVGIAGLGLKLMLRKPTVPSKPDQDVKQKA